MTAHHRPPDVEDTPARIWQRAEEIVMAKSEKKEDDRRSMEERVSEWVGNQGYRLEHVTYKAFKNARLDAVMSAFLESAEGKSREIDVTAWGTYDDEPISLRVVCECKYSTDPWVLVGCGQQPDYRTKWHAIPQSSSISKFWRFIEPVEKDLVPYWHFFRKTLIAHTIVQAFKDQKDNRDFAYQSLQKIANAAWDWAENDEKQKPTTFSVVIPCIVVDGPLLGATFDYDAERFRSESIPSGRVLWSGCRNGTAVDIVQAQALDEYVGNLWRSLDKIGEAVWFARKTFMEQGTR
jgi:hypothetical protein